MRQASSDHNQTLLNLSYQAVRNRHRYLVVLQGDREWSTTIYEPFLKESKVSNALHVSDRTDLESSCTTYNNVSSYLGQEFECIIYDSFGGFFPNTICMAEGMLIGGGLFFLQIPHPDKWPSVKDSFCNLYTMYPYTDNDMRDNFLKRFTRLLNLDKTVSLITEKGEAQIHTPVSQIESTKHEEPIYASRSQQQAVENIKHVAKGHRNRPLVMLANRGHGKSAALGIACAQLVQQQTSIRIIVTAPRKDASNILFQHAANLLSEKIEYAKGYLEVDGSVIEFIAPDVLTRKKIECNLLIVDEASAIPSPLLEMMLKNYHRTVFSTTVYGYEGNGRGFELKFIEKMKIVTPDCQVTRLDEPVRWNKNDPLEAFFYKAFLLDTETTVSALSATTPVDSNKLEYKVIGQQSLLNNELLLKELYNLLLNAHYKTTPNDLRMILDSPYIFIHVLMSNNMIVAAALIAEEGCLDEELATAVYNGKRRTKGHYLPQTLVQETGNSDSAGLRFARIIRIAVHLSYQNKGIGSVLLRQLHNRMSAKYDFIGAVFGCNARLLDFWRKNDYLLIKMGHKRNAFSGYHSAVVLNAISAKARVIIEESLQYNLEKNLFALADSLNDLDYDIVLLMLLLNKQCINDEIGERDIKELRSFSDSYRQYDHSAPSIYQLFMSAIRSETVNLLSEGQKQVLVQRVLLRLSESEIVSRNSLHGKNELQAILRQATKILLAAYN